MKKAFAVLLTILMLFSLFQGALRENVVKADETYQWIPINKGLTTNAYVFSLAIDPTNTQVIYAGTGSNGVFKSIDGGNNWSAINTRLTNTDVHSLAIDPQNSQVIYAGTWGGVFKSIDGGNNWSAKGLTNINVLSLAIDPINTQIIYAETLGGVFKSTDGGSSWNVTGLTNTIVYFLAIDPTNTNIIYAGTLSGVFKSIDGGNNWSTINTRLELVYSLAIDPKNTQVIYAGTFASGVLKSTDGGKNWIEINNGLGNKNVHSLAIDATDTNIIYAGTDNGVFKYTQGKKITQKVIVIVLQIGKPSFTVNGVSKTLDSPPVIKNNRTLLPIRTIIEALGGTVGWEPNAKKVTVSLGSTTIELWIGKNTASVNGSDTPIDSTNDKVFPEIINSRTMLPLRFVTENLGCDVQWDGTTQTITLTYVEETTSIIQIPSAPSLVLPGNNSTFTDSNITFKWTVVSGVDYYRLQTIKDNVVVHAVDNITTNTYSMQSETLTNGTYSWQVAAHNSAGWSSWSTPFVFIIQTQLSVTDIAKFVDRVVYIEVTGYKDGKPLEASGSGFIISSDGEIVTNYHVIDGATSGTVTLNDGMKYDIVSVLGYAKPKEITDKDLAIVKINASNLPVCTLGNSDKVQVGESVVTIGSPLGLPNVVSNGIVSKVWGEGIIQVTAPISPGNSGGPLFNMFGEVIGINTFSATIGQNINFALPINWVKTMDMSLNMTLEQVYQKEYGSVPSLPGTPSLLSPADGSVLTTTTPTLTWTTVSNVDYYGVAVMEGSVKDTDKIIWTAFPTTTSITIPSGKLQTGKIYTWVVVAHNSYGYGNDSYAWHFSVAAPQLIAPILLSPDDKEPWAPSLHNYAITFKWSPVTGVSYYILWIGTGLSGEESTNIYKKQTTDTTLTLSTSSLPAGEIYTWAVGAVNSLGKVVWSEDRHFSLIKEKAISIISPYNGEHTFSGSLSWASYPGANEYWVYVTDEYGNLVYLNTTTISSDVVPSNKLILGKKYLWSVAAVKNSYGIAMSDISTFYYGY